jgi:hypothetical protein
MFGLGGFETVACSWFYLILCSGLALRTRHPLARLIPTAAGLFLLTVAYWLAPWLSFNPHRYLFNYIHPIWSEVAAEAGFALIDWFGPDAIQNILTATGQVLNLNAPLLGAILPTVGLSLRFLLWVVLPGLMLVITVRLLATAFVIATNAQVEVLRKRIAVAQTIVAGIVLLLLLWAIPEIDAWGYPMNTDAGLAVMALSPEIGAGPWLTLTALTLLIGGGLYEAFSTIEPTYRSKNREIGSDRNVVRRDRVHKDNAQPKRRYRK